MFTQTHNPFEEHVSSSIATEPLQCIPNAIGRSDWNQQIRHFETSAPLIRQVATKASNTWVWLFVAGLVSLFLFYLYKCHYNKIQVFFRGNSENDKNQNV